jgi:hypothetical protein
MGIRYGWRQRANGMASRLREAASTASRRVSGSWTSGLNAVGAGVSGTYTAALTWKNNSEFSEWLKDHLSVKLDSSAKAVSKAMDATYNDTYIAGNWHRLYDGTHTILGSWKAALEALPDADLLEQLGAWANSYWNDLITQRGMPIITLDSNVEHGQYLKYPDSFNLAETVSGPLSGVSFYSSWNDPKKLVASSIATDFGAVVYANVLAPLVTLIGLGRSLSEIGARSASGLDRPGSERVDSWRRQYFAHHGYTGWFPCTPQLWDRNRARTRVHF